MFIGHYSYHRLLGKRDLIFEEQRITDWYNDDFIVRKNCDTSIVKDACFETSKVKIFFDKRDYLVYLEAMRIHLLKELALVNSESVRNDLDKVVSIENEITNSTQVVALNEIKVQLSGPNLFHLEPEYWIVMKLNFSSETIAIFDIDSDSFVKTYIFKKKNQKDKFYLPNGPVFLKYRHIP